ncbi:MAG: VOC family protein [Nitrososphaerota archaeon]|nr:VOC family protein [Nitrososphaerota archaeon]
MSEEFRLPEATRVGPPVLRVKDLERMLGFYQGVFGLQVNRKNEDLIYLGFGKMKSHADPLLVLKHDPSARETQHDFAGLYHFAILVPDRKSLAQAYLGIQRKAQFDGFGDHLVSESLYMHDPEHNGIEIYRDRPRSEWPRKDGKIVMDTQALDFDGILSELSKEDVSQEAFPNGARIGHIHLRVTDLERSARFYHEKLGFDVTFDLSSMGAMFLSAGGYHHHIGLNTWHSLNGKSHEAWEAGLEQFTIEVPSPLNKIDSRLEGTKISDNELLVSDPDNIPVLVRSV